MWDAKRFKILLEAKYETVKKFFKHQLSQCRLYKSPSQEQMEKRSISGSYIRSDLSPKALTYMVLDPKIPRPSPTRLLSTFEVCKQNFLLLP